MLEATKFAEFKRIQDQVVILRGLAKDPAERYPTATSMAQALADAFNLSTPVLSDLSDATASTINGLSNWDQTQQNVVSRTPQQGRKRDMLAPPWPLIQRQKLIISAMLKAK